MRTLDRKHLATHPEGDEKADMTFSVPVPKSANLPNNPDGSRPQIFLQAVADTYAVALTALTMLRDDNWSDTVEQMIFSACSEEEQAVLLADGDPSTFLEGRFKEVVSPSRVSTFEVAVTEELDDGTKTEQPISITITAPSVELAHKGVMHLTSPRMLQSAAIGFCPEIDDDEYGDSNEVLVIG